MSRGFVLAAIACGALVVGTYWNSLDNGFHFDDSHVVQNNLYIRSLRQLPRYFTDATTFSSIRTHASYRPLVSATLALDYARGGLDPRPYHETQIALLLGLGALLTAFYARLLRDAGADAPAWTALLAATFFCVHTANTETMNFISSRSEELAVIGVVGSFLVWLTWPGRRASGMHLLPMAIGALGKILAVMYGPLLFSGVWLWQPSGTTAKERTRAARRQTWPALTASAAVYLFVRAMDAPEWTGGGTTRLPYAWTQPLAWLHYARLFILPRGLSADSDWTLLPAWYDTRALAGFAFVAVLGAIVWRTWRRAATAPIAFGITWFAVALVPTSSVFPFSEVVNEHRVFFPYVGLVLAAACALPLAVARLARPARSARAIGAAIAVALIATHAVATRERNTVWRSEETLWRDVTVKSPGNQRGLMNYGITQMAHGDYTTARDYFERAARLNPNYSYLEINLGIVYGQLRQDAGAEQHFQRALALSPDADGHFYYGRWLASVGRGPEALDHVARSIAISPGDLDARHLLMRLLAAANEDARLKSAAAEILGLDPGDQDANAYARAASPLAGTAVATMQAGLAALGMRQFADAAEIFRAVVLADPRSADGWNNRGWAQYSLGFPVAARDSYLRALSIDPAHGRARNNLALIAVPSR